MGRLRRRRPPVHALPLLNGLPQLRTPARKNPPCRELWGLFVPKNPENRLTSEDALTPCLPAKIRLFSPEIRKTAILWNPLNCYLICTEGAGSHRNYQHGGRFSILTLLRRDGHVGGLYFAFVGREKPRVGTVKCHDFTLALCCACFSFPSVPIRDGILGFILSVLLDSSFAFSVRLLLWPGHGIGRIVWQLGLN